MDNTGTSPGSTRVALRTGQYEKLYQELLIIHSEDGISLTKNQQLMIYLSAQLKGIMALIGDVLTQLDKMKYAENSNKGVDVL